ncbi:DUF1150 domain-containing protein [Jannaschia sp. CCS1]|uniref:DUF1150 domain-containing protein n=1 Tax=Jannaschia sp. (strain CCS1) TaxID=290400 RepID=UPI000053C08F|nr:DUF1150 domain-containing protein [Jannaschia sp. CCS1]ABD56266.1 hypothetical protein Jann_3349 [Jannaschia sp. CCS1]
MTDADSTTQTSDRKIVYIREVAVDDLPQEVQEQAQGLKTLFAIGGPDGEQLALVRNRELAFVVARQNDMQPLSVH